MTEYRTTADIAALIGVSTDTVRVYRTHSKPGGRYETHPFPQPDKLIGRTPVWSDNRDDEIRTWAAARPGRGAGGGRPAHQSTPDAKPKTTKDTP